MQTALITGTSGGIGLATAKALNLRGINVVGLSRSTSGYSSPIFREITIDITDTPALTLCIRQLCKEYDFDILINNAGAAYYGLHENLSAAMIHEIVSVNLEAPMIICSLMINRLKKNHGTIINISSATAKRTPNTHGAAYAASKAGLTSFSESLFAEVRKHGIRVVTLHPDMTDTGLYRNADFTADPDYGCSLRPEDVADAVVWAVSEPAGINVNDITISPQYHRIKRK